MVDIDSAVFGIPDQQTAVDRRYLELRGQLLNRDGLRKIEPPEAIIDGYLFCDSLTWLGGKPGHAKTLVAIDQACCVGTGTAWHGHHVKQGRVLYLIAEGVSGFNARVDAWELAHGIPVANVLFLPTPVQMMNPLDVAAFCQLLEDVNPTLVVLDTQARVTVGAEENSSRDMGQFVEALETIRRHTAACIYVVHHEPRNGENLRGSTALEGAATTILRSNKDGDVVEVSNPKQKDIEPQPKLTLTLRPIGDSVILSHARSSGETLTESESHILTTLRESFGTAGARKTELKEADGQPKTSFYRGLNLLVNKGLVIATPVGQSPVYTLGADSQQTSVPLVPPSQPDRGIPSPTSHPPFRGGTSGNPWDGRPGHATA